MTSPLAFLPNIGPLEVAIVLLILLVIFGPKRIPAAFKSIGEGIRGLRESVDSADQKKDPAAISSPPEKTPATPEERAAEEAEHSGSGSGARPDA